MQNLLKIIVFLSILSLCGCVSLPTESVSSQITTVELSQHVDFLTQPALKGRSAGSWESKHVRQYLSQRLEQYGCMPWGNTDSFEQDFGFGKNIIALLPGSDLQCADEIILISAHYDHLKAKLFSTYPGACDNAAAVAGLLEIAENLSQAEQRPKRTICFAFFDAEEMFCLGSFAFTCRDDYDDSRIVAAINMDLLGRDLLDVVDNCLIVTGTENYASLGNRINTVCAESDLKMLPLESDLIGPVGDHIAFTSSHRPVLFFTCGINKDYHQPSDTADRLNFDKLKKECNVIEQTLLSLADADAAMLSRVPAPITGQCIESFSYILKQFEQNRDMFKLDPNDIKTLDELITKTNKLDPNTLSHSAVLHTERDTLDKLMKLLKHYDQRLFQYGNGFLQISKFYATAPETVTEAYRKLVKHYLENKPSLFKSNKFSYKKYLPINANDWGVAHAEDGVYIFGLLEKQIRCEAKLDLLKMKTGSFGIYTRFFACKGTLQEIYDYIAMEASRREIEQKALIENKSEETTPAFVLNEMNDDIQRISKWTWLREELKAKFPETAFTSKFTHFNDPENWPHFHERWCLESSYEHGTPPPGHNYGLIFPSSPEDIEQFVQLLQDPNTNPEIRVSAISILEKSKSASSLHALVDILEDTTIKDTTPWWLYEKHFPLKDNPFFQETVPEIKKYYEKNKPKNKTFGQLAQQALERATGQNFGQDKTAWKKWIEKHITDSSKN